jgi:hypothetical protein
MRKDSILQNFYYNNISKAEDGKEYQGSSIVDYLATKGYSGKKDFRKQLAEQYGVEDYDFSAKKNLELLNKLRENQEILEKIQPSFSPIPVEKIMEMEKQTPKEVTTPVHKTLPNKNKVDLGALNARLNLAMMSFNKPSSSSLRTTPFTSKMQWRPPSSVPPAPTSAAPSSSSSFEVPEQTFFPGVSALPSIPQSFKFPINFGSFNTPFPVVNTTPKPEKVTIDGQEYTTDSIEYKNMYDQGLIGTKVGDTFYGNKSELEPVIVKSSKPLKKETNLLKDFYNSFLKALENNPYLQSGVNLGGAGFSPEGIIQISKDFDENVVYPAIIKTTSLFSKDLSEKERKSQIDFSKIKSDPVYLTGNAIKDDERRYHTPEHIDLDYVRFGVRNRGDIKDIDTEGGVITTFDPFVNAKKYFASVNDPSDATYIGISSDGKVTVGRKDIFQNLINQDSDYMITKTYGNKVIDFNRDASGKIIKVRPSEKASKSKDIVSPSIKVMQDDGKIVDGRLNLLLPINDDKGESFDLVTGGRYIFQTPDGKKTRMVSGSLKDIESAFYAMKKNNPYLNVITLDNGSYSRGIRTYDKKLTKNDLKKYDNQNVGGGNFLYILPNSSKTRYESRFSDFESEAKKILQSLYPGKKVSVNFQNTGLYDESGGRDISSQLGIQKAGNSQTPVSLHNFNAARDYKLYVDNELIDPDKNKDIYKKVLWNSANKTGLYHLEDWDPTHISLAKEGQKTAFDELYEKYPDLFETKNFQKSLDFIIKNKDNPLYKEIYD